MLETLFVAILTALILAAIISDRLQSDPDPLEELKARRATGEIDQQTFETELEFMLDDRNERIRAVVEDINGVGEATSEALAREFDSLEDLRAADRERLEGVYGVGEETAGAVLERVRAE